MPFVSGFLQVRERGHPGNELPGVDGPVDPGFGIEAGGGIPGNLPSPPPGVWPPLTPGAPIQPAPPGTPPGSIWPPIHPVYPSHGLPNPPQVDAGLPGTPARPDAGLPPSPGHPAQPLPPSPGHPSGGPVQPPGSTLPAKTWWVVVGIPGVGWRYAAIDPSLSAGYPLPPTATPK